MGRRGTGSKYHNAKGSGARKEASPATMRTCYEPIIVRVIVEIVLGIVKWAVGYREGA